MKKVFLLFLFATLVFMCNAQKDSTESIMYLTGTSKFSDYDIKTCVTPLPPNYKLIKTKSGKSAPILSLYVANKSNYIGGVLENPKGKTTIITDIIQREESGNIRFVVTGEDFDMSFTLENGSILKEENGSTIFYTDDVGIWKIKKK